MWRRGKGKESKGKWGMEENGERKRRKEKREERKREGIWKAVFWNVAGLARKNDNFWKESEEWDVITMSERWLGEGEG